MSLTYDGKKIIPAPLVTISKEYTRSGDGTKLGSIYNITLRGTLLPFRGSPSGNYASLDTAFWTLGGYPPDETFAGGNEDFDNLLRKQEAVRDLFSNDGRSLEWQPSGGQPVVKTNPKILNVNFDEGQWADRVNYQISCQSNWIYINGTLDVEDDEAQDLIESHDESWNFEEVTGRNGEQYNVTHEVSAKGMLGFDENAVLFESKEAWEHARDFVNLRASGVVDPSIMFAAIGTTDDVQGNFVRNVVIDKAGGTYSVTEQWLISEESSKVENEWTVDYNNDTGEFTVTYRGTIFGLATGAKPGDIANVEAAKAEVPSDLEAKNLTESVVGTLINGQSLPNVVESKSFILNQQEGTVQFTFTWTTSEDADADARITGLDAQLVYDRSQNSFVVSLTQDVEGKGTNKSVKLSNARAAVYTNTEARASALSILGISPVTLDLDISAGDISTVHKNKTTAVSENAGTIRTTWSWDNRSNSGLETSISLQLASATTAVIPIPGRSAGPIVQNMNTPGPRIITVTMRTENNFDSDGNFVVPNLNTFGAAVDYLGESNLINISDNESSSIETGRYERTTRFIEGT